MPLWTVSLRRVKGACFVPDDPATQIALMRFSFQMVRIDAGVNAAQVISLLANRNRPLMNLERHAMGVQSLARYD